jgi:hypothetical protein
VLGQEGRSRYLCVRTGGKEWVPLCLDRREGVGTSVLGQEGRSGYLCVSTGGKE